VNEDVRPKTPIVVWLLTGSIVAAYLAFFAAPASTQEFVYDTFALVPQRFHADSQDRFDQWWEALGPLFGHSFLHLGWWHVGGNVLFLFGASRWPSLRLGAWRYLVVYFAAVLAGATVYEYTALQVKQAVVGHGKAAKEQVQEMVKRLLKLDTTPQADAADALATAITHAHSRQGFGALGAELLANRKVRQRGGRMV